MTWLRHPLEEARSVLREPQPVPWSMAARHAVGVGIPLAVGAITGGILPAVAAVIGGTLASLSDRTGPVRTSVGWMAASTAVMAVFATLSIATSTNLIGAALVLATITFALGTLTAASRNITQVATAGSVVVIALAHLAPHESAWAVGGLVLAGGGIQILLALLSAAWSALRRRVRRHPADGATAETGHPGTDVAPTPPVTVRQSLRHLRPDGSSLLYGLTLAVSVTGLDLLSRVVGGGHAYWVPLAFVMVTRPDWQTTVSRSMKRLFGTIAGVLVSGVLVDVVLQRNTIALTVLAVIAVFGLRRFMNQHYGISSFCQSAVVVVLLTLSGSPQLQVVPLRALDTLIGGGLAVLVALARRTVGHRIQDRQRSPA